MLGLRASVTIMVAVTMVFADMTMLNHVELGIIKNMVFTDCHETASCSTATKLLLKLLQLTSQCGNLLVQAPMSCLQHHTEDLSTKIDSRAAQFDTNAVAGLSEPENEILIHNI